MKRTTLLTAGAVALAALTLLVCPRADAAPEPQPDEAWDHHFADFSRAQPGAATLLLWSASTDEPVLSEVNEIEIRDVYDLQDGHGPRLEMPCIEIKHVRPFILELWQNNALLYRRWVDRNAFELSWNQ